jgi:hypothetical protein
MAAAVLIFLYITILFYIYGWITLHFLFIKLKLEDGVQPVFIMIWLTGFCVVTTIAACLSIFIPLAEEANLILIAGLVGIVIYIFRHKKIGFNLPLDKPVSRLDWVLLFLVVFAVIETSTQRARNPDSGIYHVQFIQWIENYRAVPGLANLYTQYGFNPNWLLANAFFSFSFLKLQSFHVLPGALVLVYELYFLSGVINLIKGRARISDWIAILLIPISFEIISVEFASPGTDLPVTFLEWVILLEWMKLFEDPTARTSLTRFLLVALTAFTITLKLSAAPLLLIAIWIGWSLVRSKNYRLLGWAAAVAVIITVPWLVRNVIISGYLVYPIYEINLFNVDWKVPFSQAVNERVVLVLNRYHGTDVTEIASWPLKTWVRNWYLNLTFFRRVMVWIVSLGPFAYLIYLLVRIRNVKSILQKWKPYLPVYLIIYAGLAFWFFGSPAMRFGYGFLITGILLTMVPVIKWAFDHFQPRAGILPALVVLLLIMYQGTFIYRSIDIKTLDARLVLPANYINLPSHPCKGRNMTLSCADLYNECWYSTFPCVPSLQPSVGMRGAHLVDGFNNLVSTPIK